MSDTPQVLSQHYLRMLCLPIFRSAHDKPTRQCETEKKAHIQYLLWLCELARIQHIRRMIDQ